jgi:hypothetical protein
MYMLHNTLKKSTIKKILKYNKNKKVCQERIALQNKGKLNLPMNNN